MNEAGASSTEATTLHAARRLRWVSWICAVSPFIVISHYFSMAIHVRAGLGHWPKPMIENYNTEAMRLHELGFSASVVGMVYVAPVVWGLCCFFRALRPSWPRTALKQLGAYALGWVFIVIIISCDPTTFTAWFFD